jgi:hypothetical protein
MIEIFFLLILVLVVLYLFKSKTPNSPTSLSSLTVKKAIFALFFAPAPFFMCFDGCLGPEPVLPLIIAWFPFFFTSMSIASLPRALWHLLFIIIFALIYIPLAHLIDQEQKYSPARKKTHKICVYVLYWCCITILWMSIPIVTRMNWLGQTG